MSDTLDLGALQSLLERVRGLKIACVGDLMLDRYVYGEVSRISPEAPIPVLWARSRRSVLGGAGNDNIDGSESADQSMDAVDTAVYLAQAGLDSTDFSFVDGAFTVSTVTGGVDTLVNIEKVESLAADGVTVASRFLLVGNGGYSSIQDAINAAAVGDTVIIASGNYVENLTINKGITVLGANFGKAGIAAEVLNFKVSTEFKPLCTPICQGVLVPVGLNQSFNVSLTLSR